MTWRVLNEDGNCIGGDATFVGALLSAKWMAAYTGRAYALEGEGTKRTVSVPQMSHAMLLDAFAPESKLWAWSQCA